MKEKNFFQKMLLTFDNSKEGHAARKWTAFIIILCTLTGHIFYFKHCFIKEDFSIFAEVLIIDYVAAGFFLGLVTFQNIIELKNGSTNTKPPPTTES
jgi:hypothetical protein